VPGLTSAALVWVLSGLVAAGLGLVIWAWPRLAGPGTRQAALRLIALCLVQAIMLTLAFVLVNRAGGFYASWSDVLDRYTGGGTLHVVDEDEIGKSAQLTVMDSAPVRIKRGVSSGTLETVLVRGALSGLSLAGHVYLPPGYPHTDGHDRRYPVIVVISRAQTGVATAIGASRVASAIAEQIARGQIQPLILVTLPAGPASDPGCLNVPGGAQGALFFSQDLPAAIGSHYLVNTGRDGWGLLGDSSGGYCALQLALTNASAFSVAAVPAGRYTAPPGPHDWTSSPQFRLQDNLAWLVWHQPMQPISVLFTGRGHARPFLAAAHRPMQATDISSVGAWPDDRVLDWLGRRVLSAAGGGR
jgi:enterochelin esterase-like enzyme